MRILIAAGGTGGHLFPALRLAEEIESREVGEILFVTSLRKQDIDMLTKKDIRFCAVPLIGLQSRGVLAVFDFAIRLVAGTIKSLFLLLRFRPSVTIGFGGYISGPILLLSSLFRIKTIIHEQNVYPGKTNRILANFVDKIAITFPATKDYLKRFESKTIITGNPLRKGLKRTRKTGNTFIILAMGGSQGSHALNKLVPEAVDLMQGDSKEILEIIHISGYRERHEVLKAYQDKGIKNRVFSFTEEINKLYNESDFVIARAGATTVSELLYLAKPSILIPYPHANGHQLLNARVLVDKGIAVLLEEQDLKAKDLCDAITKFMDRGVLMNMSSKVDVDSDDACDILVNMITQIIAH